MLAQLQSAERPEGRIRLSMSSARLPGEPFTVHMEDKAALAEARTTDLLVDVLSFRADRFVAGAFDIPPAERHEKHDMVFDRCAGLINYLRGPERYGAEECSRAISIVLPAFLFLLGGVKFPGFVVRKCEWEELQLIAALIRVRLANPGPSCSECFHPLPCTCAKSNAA